MKKFLAIVLTVVCALSLVACGSRASSEKEVPDFADVAGTYDFTEEVNLGDNSFETPWQLTLKDDGTYELTSEGMMAVNITGTYTIDDATTVTTGAPNETDVTILANFFEEDYSCSWTIDVEAKQATPVKYNGATEGTDTAGDSSAVQPDYENVAYATVSDAQVCNIYLSESAKKDAPVIVLVHGGGFKFGNQTMELIQPVIRYATANGYAVVSVDYRKSDEAQFPAALADVKAAVRFVRAEADTYGFDADNITLWGESAGAYLSLMTALTPEVPELDGDVKDNASYSSAVNALVDFYGPVEFYTMKDEYQAMGIDAGNGVFESDFLGVDDIYQDKAACDRTYWENYKEQLPSDFVLKAWIQVGDENDTNVPYTQSENFAERLKQVPGVKVSYEQIKGAGHEDEAFYTDENLAKVFAFLGE